MGESVALDSRTRSPSKVCRRISWDETYGLCNKLVSEIYPIRYRLHTIAAIANGGIIPASMMAYKLQLNLQILQVPPMDFNQDGVLLLDDVYDSGYTIKQYVEDHRWHWEATAGFVVKPWCPYKPTFIGEETEDWVVFAWE